MIRTRISLLAVGATALGVGCSAQSGAGSSQPASPRPTHVVVDASGSYESVSESLEDASELETLIGPYRTRMASELSEVLGTAQGPFLKADPEGALDNLVSDAVLDEIQEMLTEPIDAVMLNDGGLRVPIAAGPIRVRHAYELLPFENHIVILTLSGEQMEALADQVARTGGEPIAGWTMVLDGEDATHVRVGGSPLIPDRVYRLATVDFLADGGGSWSVLWEPRDREDLPVLIRDVFVDYVREEGVVVPVLDGRITLAGGRGEGSGR